MHLVVTAADGTTELFADVNRYSTDEHNNLMVFTADSLVGLYAAEQWRSAVLKEV